VGVPEIGWRRRLKSVTEREESLLRTDEKRRKTIFYRKEKARATARGSQGESEKLWVIRQVRGKARDRTKGRRLTAWIFTAISTIQTSIWG